ncbi:mannitol repressor MtlR [Mesocricetibacter intestinalis]|uniref:Mannitol repressor MtlR n=1 Tax=Mesocricetibacter intestinalis TaxID=1521930 RepID=A0A4R6VCT8_9PAST|nr:MltR family transcriptional regulator [Mesocricetibacter intestinalis]TDQ58055.1 mannitol repressor MtlR [Mesocricetibacter intestinalis]
MSAEEPIYEKLNDAVTIRGFITASVAIFDEAVDNLINRVFRKTDFVVESVIESLFVNSGPLSDLSVRLKVLLGLGVISHNVYADINAFLRLKEQLNNDEKEYLFSDPPILEFIRSLNFQQNNAFLNLEPASGDTTSLLYQVKALRREKLIRSCLILNISDIYAQLQIESPL